MQDDPRRAAEEEEATERTILALLLSGHPAPRTRPELERELGKSKDAVVQALCALADYGLLEFEGGKTETLRPSLAARSCHRLDSS